jgi:hypothetical protein
MTEEKIYLMQIELLNKYFISLFEIEKIVKII